MRIPANLLLALGLAAFSQPALAQRGSGGATIAMPAAGGAEAGAAKGMTIEAGIGRVITLPNSAANVFVADPKVLEVHPASPTSLYMFGVAPGRTTVAAMDGNGHAIAQYTVTVRPSAYGASEASSAIARAIPGSNVQVEALGNTVLLRGRVKDAAAAEKAESIVRSYLPEKQTVDNRLSVSSSTQVGLRVRVVEMSRSLTRELGINWQALGNVGNFTSNFASTAVLAQTATSFATFGASNISAVIDLLAQDNLVRTLAEPNLVTISGETASFLAGGEIPIIVPQATSGVGGSVNTVSFKQYGVMLTFVPTVMSDRRISLHVRPEVSAISTANSNATGNVASALGSNTSTDGSSQAYSGLTFTVRRADTTVELGSGQSFAIAGLLQDNINHSVNALPILGELPILGPLFRSDSFVRNETELVIIVTPYIVQPTSDPTALRTPDQNYAPPNDLDRLVRMRQIGQRAPLPPAHAPGAAGFLVE